jgi:hypothetical protein
MVSKLINNKNSQMRYYISVIQLKLKRMKTPSLAKNMETQKHCYLDWLAGESVNCHDYFGVLLGSYL